MDPAVLLQGFCMIWWNNMSLNLMRKDKTFSYCHGPKMCTRVCTTSHGQVLCDVEKSI